MSILLFASHSHILKNTTKLEKKYVTKIKTCFILYKIYILTDNLMSKVYRVSNKYNLFIKIVPTLSNFCIIYDFKVKVSTKVDITFQLLHNITNALDFLSYRSALFLILTALWISFYITNS